MYRDCVITSISDLSFYGKVMIQYLEKNNEKAALRFVLNEDKSVTGTVLYPEVNKSHSLSFSTVKEMSEYLEKIRDRIYLIKVA